MPFGIEVMGRVRDFGSLDDVIEISRRTGWVRPVLDFAHMHATSDGAYTEVEPFAEALEAADGVLEAGAPFHIHFSDIAYANRNETKHLPYGEGTLRADPLAEALRRFERPATVISSHPTRRPTRRSGPSSPRVAVVSAPRDGPRDADAVQSPSWRLFAWEAAQRSRLI